MSETHQIPARRPSGAPAIGGLISSLGRRNFGAELITLLRRECDAEHCSVLQYRQHEPKRVLSVSADGSDSAQRSIDIYLDRGFSRRDLTVHEARRLCGDGAPVMMKVSIDRILDTHFRDVMYRRTGICERVLIFDASCESEFAVSILRSDKTGPFPQGMVSRLSEMAPDLLAIVRRHAEVIEASAEAWPVLTSLPDIEARILRAGTSLPLREAQVCARILHGMHVSGIASDLGVGDESVLTYRKRAFQRLDIGSRHELMVWYIDLCRRHAS